MMKLKDCSGGGTLDCKEHCEWFSSVTQWFPILLGTKNLKNREYLMIWEGEMKNGKTIALAYLDLFQICLGIQIRRMWTEWNRENILFLRRSMETSQNFEKKRWNEQTSPSSVCRRKNFALYRAAILKHWKKWWIVRWKSAMKLRMHKSHKSVNRPWIHIHRWFE